jgi:dipeptidyl-peptidase-4
MATGGLVTNSPIRRRLWLAVAVLAILAAPASAQKKKLTIEDLTAEPPLPGRAVAGLTWLPGSDNFSYLVRTGAGEDSAAELILENAGTGKKTTVASPETLALPEDAKPADSASGAERRRPRRASLDGYRWAPDGKTLVLSGGDDLWLYHADERKLERLTHEAGTEEFPQYSPDGKLLAFTRKNDLYVLDLASRKEKRLTTDGAEHVFNGRLDWVYEEELASRTGRGYEWSPDSSAIAYLRLDETRVDSYPLVDYLKVPAGLKEQRYPKAGSPNSTASFHVVGVDGSPRGEAKPEGDIYIVPAFSWTADSKSVCYRVLNRAQDSQEVRLLSVPGGASKTLFVEKDPYWINVADPPKFLKDGRYVWKSERDGYAHIYVGNISGGEPKAITSGQWMVDRIVGVDESRNLVYFTANEENIRRRSLYRVLLDGSRFTRYPLAAGTHVPEVSPDGLYVLDTFSTTTAPPIVSLLDFLGRPLRAVYRPDNRLSEYELAASEEVEVSADDGTKLMARLVKPANFDPSKKYPVVVYVYGGPHSQVVRDAWGAASLFDHYLVSKGYLLWSVDNRGSFGRGHAWESAVFKNMGKRELADQLAGVKYLKSLTYVDPARIGIWGWSYGGYMTLYSLTNAPDVFKCGVAGAPVTDWKFYDTIYTERYMRTPKDNPQGYESSAPLSKAKDLKAKLLIMHGTSDDNVHLQNSMAFIDALVKAGKPYQLEVVPGQRHGFRGKDAINFRNMAIAKFFEENL